MKQWRVLKQRCEVVQTEELLLLQRTSSKAGNSASLQHVHWDGAQAVTAGRERTQVKAALRGEMPGPGEGLTRAGRGHVPQEDQCRWDWCISPSFRTQSPADSNHLTRHMVETRAGAVITFPSVYFPCVFRSALGRQFQHESQAHWGRVSSQPWWQRLRLPGCRLGFPTCGPAWNKRVHNLHVFKSTALFSRLWGSQVHSHTFWGNNTHTDRKVPVAAVFP